MARPRVVGSLITGFLAERRRGTARDVAYGLQLSIPRAAEHLHRLQRNGAVVVLGRERVEHASRLVFVYGLSESPGSNPVMSDDWLRRR
jgi:predicted ArsR family transcriptional regulator